MEFNTKCRYNCFGKQSHIDTCTQAFRDLERFGFEFGEFGFAAVHVHFQVNVPKCYSIEDAEIMIKSHSAKKMFEQHPLDSGNDTRMVAFGAGTSTMNLQG